MIAIPGIREGDADPQSSELQARHRGLGQEFPPTTGERLVDWTHLISTKSHGIPFLKAQKLDLRWWESVDGERSRESGLLQSLPEEKSMSNLAKVVQQLRNERVQAQTRIEQLDEALKALTGVGGRRGTTGTRRTMSAAARKRIAAAQRARWAKWKAARKHK